VGSDMHLRRAARQGSGQAHEYTTFSRPANHHIRKRERSHGNSGNDPG
jgi:hypothetical protein